MNSGDILQSRFVNALRSQARADCSSTKDLACLYQEHSAKVLHNADQLNSHAKIECTRTRPQADDDFAGRGDGRHQDIPEKYRKRESALLYDLGRAPTNIGLSPYSKPDLPMKSPHHSSPPYRSQSSLMQDNRHPNSRILQRYDPPYPGLLLQPDSRPISQEQLASEVKSIYAGLTMVETKCIHVDRAQAAAVRDTHQQKLSSDHWQALIALHRTLLHEHHDFFIASQHPFASPALRRLAAKYSMPSRMWKHGIHSFLELLRQRLLESIDYMLAFIYLAYQTMALLYETVPAFEDTWIECLGDLSHYRMAIEDEHPRDRETWAGVARSWYCKAADKNPKIGRLYHHLAILARPNTLDTFFVYSNYIAQVFPHIATQIPPDFVQESLGAYFDISSIHRNCTFHSKGLPKIRRELFTKYEPITYDALALALHRISGKNVLLYVHITLSFLTTFATSKYACRTFEQLEQVSYGIWRRMCKLISTLLKSHKNIIATSLCATRMPNVYATSDIKLDVIPSQTHAPVFGFNTTYDRVLPGLMIVYLIVTFFLRAKTRFYSKAFRVSYGISISMGLLNFIVNRDEFADAIRTTVFEIWFTSTLHIGSQYCYDNYYPIRHILTFLGLATVPGWVLVMAPSLDPLDIIPTYVAVVSLIAWALYEYQMPNIPRQQQNDEEQGGHPMLDLDPVEAEGSEA